MNQLPANAARHVLLVALGSAGDVHPFVGIALELIRRGHTVSIASNPMFEDLIRSAGADFVPLGTVEDYHSTTENPDLWHPTKGFKLVIQFGFINPMQPVYEFIRDRYQPGKTIVAAHCLALGARIAQEHLGVPLATLHMSPAVLRSVHQMANLKGGHLPDWAPKFLKRLLYFTVDKLLIDPMLVKPVNEFRRELGLTDRVSRIMKDWWMSPESVIGIFPEFFSPLQPDWPAQLKLTSFPLYDAGGHESVPAELEAFLAAGEPPVVVTPGSANRHAQEHFATAVAACVALKRRGVLLSKFPENVPPNLPPTIRHFPYALSRRFCRAVRRWFVMAAWARSPRRWRRACRR